MSELNVPESWVVGEVGILPLLPHGQVSDPKDAKDAECLVEMEDIQKDTGNISFDRDIPSKISTKNVFFKDDVLYGKLRPYLNKCGVAKHNGICSSEIFVIGTCEFESNFLAYFFRSPYFLSYADSKTHGARMPRLSRGLFQSAELPIPPTKEQERIVQKIESCFEKIDATEQSLTKVETLLEKYRESLLAKAFRGELIPQNESDEPASVLLEKIRAEREKSAPAKKKKVQAFAPITDDEKPFDIPESWEWVSLGDLGVWSGGGTPSKQNREFWENGTVPWVSPKDMKSDVISGSRDKITQIALEERKISLLPVGTILFVTRSGILRHSLPVAWNDVEITINQDIKALILDGMVTTEYLFLCLRAFEKTILENCTKKGATVESVEFEKLKKFPIPIAPLKEQNRIIEKLHEALSSVEGSVENNKTLSKTLIPLKNSILNNAFEGRLVEQIESEGTGQELLEQILKAKAEEEPKKKVAKKKVAKKAAKKKLQKRNRIEK